jgi:predicted enzyme related to lactoylglutathione lyase
MTDHGRNVWYDLMTSDPAAAQRFYGAVIGWQTQTYDGVPGEPYTMWVAGEQPVGGVAPLPEDARKMGAPPHWLGYTAVDDVDAAAAKAASLGGKVLAPPWDVPTVGRIAVLADPQGAVFAVFKPTDVPGDTGDGVGHIGWAELNTTNYESAWKFYAALFGWKHRETMDMGGGFQYFLFSGPGGTKGGLSNAAAMMHAPAHWLYYVTVDDVNAAIERVQANGGKLLNGPMDVPGDDVIAQCQDPQGAYFAIYSHKR